MDIEDGYRNTYQYRHARSDKKRALEDRHSEFNKYEHQRSLPNYYGNIRVLSFPTTTTPTVLLIMLYNI